MRRIRTSYSISDRSRVALCYSLRRETVSNGAESMSCYGIVVVSSGGEREHVKSVTTCEKTAKRLLRIMARYRVTPLTARDIVYDWLCVQDGI